jgi:hypothetical protein
MRSIPKHIDTIRGKPHHVRQRFALGAAGVLTGVIALTWLGVSLASGRFAIKGSDFAEMSGAIPSTETNQRTNRSSQVAGAAAAPAEAAGPAHIEVISDGTGVPTKAPAKPTGPTIIPF